MPSTQPISPDDLYCVYCHAPATGACAVCHALCCGDCVELVMGLSVRRAVCRSCLARGARPADAAAWRWVMTAAVALVLVVLVILLAVGRF
jgi:hypothetical protein